MTSALLQLPLGMSAAEKAARVDTVLDMLVSGMSPASLQGSVAKSTTTAARDVMSRATTRYDFSLARHVRSQLGAG